MSYHATMQIVELVKANGLLSMLEEAWQKEGYNVYDINLSRENVNMQPDSEKSICQGKATVSLYEPIDEKSDRFSFDFEVNAGRNKDECYVFDELEILISWE